MAEDELDEEEGEATPVNAGRLKGGEQGPQRGSMTEPGEFANKAELKEELRRHGIEPPSKARRAELEEMLRDAQRPASSGKRHQQPTLPNVGWWKGGEQKSRGGSTTEPGEFANREELKEKLRRKGIQVPSKARRAELEEVFRDTQRPASSATPPHLRPTFDPQQSTAMLRKRVQVREGAAGQLEVVPLEGELPFDKGFYVVVRAIQLLAPRVGPERPLLVGLGGPTGAGKTELRRRLEHFMPMTVINMVDYTLPGACVDAEYDDPNLIDMDLLASHLKELRLGKAIDIPKYQVEQSTRVGTECLAPMSSEATALVGAPVVVLEGVYALKKEIRELLDIPVAIHGGIHFDLVKRIYRDTTNARHSERGLTRISETVFPMYKQYIEPDLQSSPIRIRNDFNPFAGFLTQAIYTLKSATGVSEQSVKAYLGPGATVCKERTCDVYLLPPGEAMHRGKDWIRIRHKNNRYSLSFEECMTDGEIIISPGLSFSVPVHALSGLLSLGYKVGAILNIDSTVLRGEEVTCKYDVLHELDNKCFFQVEGSNRAAVEAAGEAFGLSGTYVSRKYIEELQLERAVLQYAPKAKADNIHNLAQKAPQCLFTSSALTQAKRSSDVARMDSEASGSNESSSLSSRACLNALSSANEKLEQQVAMLAELAKWSPREGALQGAFGIALGTALGSLFGHFVGRLVRPLSS